MASTNKTTHYELSQYVGSDKPTYLTDYNNDMSAIDTGIYNAQTKADSGYSLANTADGKADTGITNAGLAQADATTALTRIGTMANLDTTEKTNLVGAINEVNEKGLGINFTTFKTFETSDYAMDNANAFLGGKNLTIAKNSDGSLCKLYGQVGFGTNANISGAMTVTVSNSGLTPTSEFTVTTLGFMNKSAGSGIADINRLDVTFKTNGDIQFKIYEMATGYSYTCLLFPCIIQVKDFGDTPVI